MKKKSVALIAFSFLLAACSKTDFPKYSLLKELRVLTIKALADQGEVDPGTTVTLQPVVSDIGGGGRNLTVTVTTCIDPGISLGAPVICASPDSSTTSSFSSSTLSGVGTFTGAAPTFSVSIPAVLPLFAASPSYIKYNGLAYLVIYSIAAPDGNVVTAVKRITISDPTKTTKNKNPAISGLTANGAAVATSNTFTTGSMDLKLTLSQGAETYSVMRPNGDLNPATETITTTWFYTDGEMKYQRTGDSGTNHWDASKPASRGTALIVVTHDGRGGEDYQIYEFN